MPPFRTRVAPLDQDAEPPQERNVRWKEFDTIKVTTTSRLITEGNETMLSAFILDNLPDQDSEGDSYQKAVEAAKTARHQTDNKQDATR